MTEQLDKLLEEIKLHDERIKELKEFSQKPRKLTKQYYLELKEMVWKEIRQIQKEIKLWEELGEMIYENDDTDLPPDLQEMLSELHCTKNDAIRNTNELIDSLNEQIDGLLDIMNKTNETVREVQKGLMKLSPFYLNMIQYYPNVNFDVSILEIKLKEEEIGESLS